MSTLGRLHTGADFVEAEIITKRTAIIKGLSMNYEIGYNDLVLYDENNKITQVVSKKTNTIFATYCTKQDKFKVLEDHFTKNDIKVFDLLNGFIGLGIPISISEEDFQITFYSCPVECSLVTEDETMNEGPPDESDIY